MAKRKARITLVGPLSLAVGRYRLLKDRPVISDDEELIKYCELNPDFRVQILEAEAEQKPAKAAPAKPQPKAEEQKKEEPQDAEPSAPESTESEAGPKESEPPSRLTRKRKGDGA